MQVNNRKQASFQGKIIKGEGARKLNTEVKYLITGSTPVNVDTCVLRVKKGVRALVPVNKEGEIVGRRANLNPGSSNSASNLKVVFRYLKQFKLPKKSTAKTK